MKLAAVHLWGSKRLSLFISHIPGMPPQTPPPHKHHAIALLSMYHFTVMFGIMRLSTCTGSRAMSGLWQAL